MMKKRFLSILVIFSVILPIFVFAVPEEARAAEEIDILANAVCLMEMNTGKVLYAKNADARVHPASTTKIMTVLLAVEAAEKGQVRLDDVFTAPDGLFFDIPADGSNQDIRPGEEMTYEDILYCAMVTSASEACNWIAVILAGDPASFVEMMNTRARELGCANTHFVNTHGITDNDHYVSASDMALIFAEAMGHEEFAKIAATQSYLVPATNISDPRQLTNTNRLLGQGGYYYQYCTGGKTGYTEAAGNCLVSSASNEGLDLVAVVLGTDADTEDRFTESARLFDWGFANFSYRTVLETTKLLSETPVAMGSEADSVVLRADLPVIALVDNDMPEAELTYKITVYSEQSGEPLEAPVKAGDVLGEVDVYWGDEYLGSTSLVANTTVTLAKGAFIRREIGEFFGNIWVRLVIVVLVVLFALYIALVIRYNRARKAKQREIAARRAEAMRRRQHMSTGKSFEEIEHAMSADRDR